MPHPKKRLLHHCTVHAKKTAVARCTICKAWMCKDCCRTNNHNIVCVNCDRKKSETILPAILVKPVDKPSHSISPIMLLAAITLGLCGILFGLWNMRTTMTLQDEITMLREKRGELLDQIRERNQEIAELQANTEEPAIQQSSTFKRKSAPAATTGTINGQTIGGLPFSFDNGSTDKRLVSITFDGGSESNAATDILDTLRSRNIKTTMFLTGQFVRHFPNVVRRIIADGHEIGNHSFSHPHLTTYEKNHFQNLLPNVTEAFLTHELAKADSVLSTITGQHYAPLWRAPYGELNHQLCVWAQHAGYLHVGWRQGRSWKESLDSNDWTEEESPGYHTPQQVFDKIITLARSSQEGINGGIILMHLGSARTKKDMQVHRYLGKIIDSLESMGYRIVPVSEMMKESGVDTGLLK